MLVKKFVLRNSYALSGHSWLTHFPYGLLQCALHWLALGEQLEGTAGPEGSTTCWVFLGLHWFPVSFWVLVTTFKVLYCTGRDYLWNWEYLHVLPGQISHFLHILPSSGTSEACLFCGFSTSILWNTSSSDSAALSTLLAFLEAIKTWLFSQTLN